jgi:nucleoside-diphosphate-sugar epimerase
LPNIVAFDNAGRAWEADMKQHPVAVLGGPDSSDLTSSSVWPNAAMSWWLASVMPLRPNFLKLKGDVGQVGLVNLSIGDERLLPAFIANNDTVVNLVDIVNESGAQRFEALLHVGPARLARVAREAGVEHFIHISAIGADPCSSFACRLTAETIGLVKLGHPQPDSNLSDDAKRGSPETMST